MGRGIQYNRDMMNNAGTATSVARNVFAHWAQRIAQSQGTVLETESADNEVHFAVLFPGNQSEMNYFSLSNNLRNTNFV